jgi:hypothetical protein
LVDLPRPDDADPRLHALAQHVELEREQDADADRDRRPERETSSCCSPLRMAAMISAPNSTFGMLPRPPKRLAPPTTTAVIASSS